jgi:hypothetical protein
MSKSSRGKRVRHLGPDWTVQQVAKRSLSGDETEPCSQCGTPVVLREPHHRIDVARDVDLMGRRLRSEHQQLTFCDADCADDWLGR